MTASRIETVRLDEREHPIRSLVLIELEGVCPGQRVIQMGLLQLSRRPLAGSGQLSQRVPLRDDESANRPAGRTPHIELGRETSPRRLAPPFAAGSRRRRRAHRADRCRWRAPLAARDSSSRPARTPPAPDRGGSADPRPVRCASSQLRLRIQSADAQHETVEFLRESADGDAGRADLGDPFPQQVDVPRFNGIPFRPRDEAHAGENGSHLAQRLSRKGARSLAPREIAKACLFLFQPRFRGSRGRKNPLQATRQIM